MPEDKQESPSSAHEVKEDTSLTDLNTANINNDEGSSASATAGTVSESSVNCNDESGETSESATTDSTSSHEMRQQLKHRNGKRCDLCVAEKWWRECSKNCNLIQKQQEAMMKSSEALSDEQMKARIEQLRLLQEQIFKGDIMEMMPPDEECSPNSEYGSERLLEFLEFQKQRQNGTPTSDEEFELEFDDFCLFIIKARLYNILKTKGYQGCNKVATKILDVLRKFDVNVSQDEESEEKSNGTSSATKVNKNDEKVNKKVNSKVPISANIDTKDKKSTNNKE